jgi:enolase
MKIAHIAARQILDSRGNPTIECTLFLDDGTSYLSSVPAGKSRGMYEAHEKRDGGLAFNGLGVSSALYTIEHTIAPALKGLEPNFITVDSYLCDLDGTDNKSNLGANAMLAVSLAAVRAQAVCEEVEVYELIAHACNFATVSMPLPLFNVINGGVHANNGLSIQEFLVTPTEVPNFTMALEAGVALYHTLKRLLMNDNKSIAVGDEGGFAPFFDDEYEVFEYLMKAIDITQDRYNCTFKIGLDMASSEWYSPQTQLYTYGGKQLTSTEMIALYEQWTTKYPLFLIEDGLAQNDWQGWQELTARLGTALHLVGDDLFATNPQRIWEGVDRKAANAVLIKPNQIGTITETLQAIQVCQENDRVICVSHRSGETNDDFIADLAVGASSPFIKAGAPARGERVAKYNRLAQIEESLLMGE